MRSLTVAVSMAAAMGLATVASANVGIGLPLDQYQVGTEVTNNTIVTNGNFENTVLGVPASWEVRGSSGSGAPVGPNTGAAGSFAGQGPLGAADAVFPAINGLRQQVTLSAGPHVLSSYMWNFAANFDLAVVELREATRDGGGNTTGGVVQDANLILTSNWPSAQDPNLNLDGSRGVFGYSVFTVPANGQYDLIVKWDKDSGGADPMVGVQFDRVAITPATQFRPPVAIPEPAGLSLLAIGAAGMLRRRR